jgi:hypothetical protein
MMEKEVIIQQFCLFFKSIGLEVIEETFEETTFLPGLKIRNGALIYCKEKLLHPGDMMHEAGHIAVTVAAERASLNDNVTANDKNKEGEELAVMLWTYAVCLHLKMDPAIVFHEEGYKGESEWLLENFNAKTFIGLPLLVWMGMTAYPVDDTGFPIMVKWLRD